MKNFAYMLSFILVSLLFLCATIPTAENENQGITEPILGSITTEPEESISTEPEETIVTEPETTETKEPEVTVDSEELELLACVIYQEAGGDGSCDECRRRVADVVLNRVASDKFPNTIYEVLVSPGQYGSYSKTGVVWPARAKNPGEAHAVVRAYRIAEEVLKGHHSDLYGEDWIWQASFAQGTEQFKHCGHVFGRG